MSVSPSSVRTPSAGPEPGRAAVRKPASVAERDWTEARWRRLERETRARLIALPADPRQRPGEGRARKLLVAQARGVLRSFSTGFFIATRFLPRRKRKQVELIYAAVRYPDEVVDTFPLSADEKLARLGEWKAGFEKAITLPSIRERVSAGVPTILAGFADVVRGAGIPPAHYRSFLAAMRHDVHPRPFADLDDLIDSYIYGSAIVVGYFLAYVYGPGEDGDFERSLEASRRLGIALQLTNFLRDVPEDEQRGRLYLPQDILQEEGVLEGALKDGAGMQRVLVRLAEVADRDYQFAIDNLDAFAADTRTAIGACIAVYRQLNRQIATSDRALIERQSVPWQEKLRVLPPSKLWRLPLAYLGVI